MKKFFSLIAAVLFAGSMFAADVTITPANCGWSSEAGGQSGVVDGVTIAVTKGLASTGQNPDQIRIYKGETLTISSEANITKVVFTCTANGTAKYGPGSFAAQDGYTFEAEGKTGTWEGSAKSLTFVAETNQVRATEIVVTTDGEAPVTMAYYVCGSMTEWGPRAAYKLVANPEAEGEFMGEFTFAANDEFKVVWSDGATVTDDHWFPSGMENNYKITEAGDYAVYFRPDGQGGEGWHYGYIFAAKKETPVVDTKTCADVYSLAKGDAVELGDVVVTFANGKNVWVKDETASLLLYLSANTTWQAGDVLSGVAGAVDIYNGVTEVKPSADQAAAVVATPGEAPAPVAVVEVTLADVNKYIVLQSVEAEGSFTEGTQSNLTIAGVTVRNQFKNGFTFEAGKKYDVVGVVTIYQNNPQVYFISASESAQQGIEEILSEGKTVKVVREGKLVILKGDHTYTPMGQIVK